MRQKRLVEGIVSLGVSDALSQRLREAESEREKLLQQLKPSSCPDLDIEKAVRGAIKDYQSLAASLEAALHSDIERARESLRKLMGRITLSEDETGALWAEFQKKQPVNLPLTGCL